MTSTNEQALVQVAHPLPDCALVTLNRPQAMNALSGAMRRELVRAIDALAADGSTRVLVLTGAGRAFCAGLDLKELGAGALSARSAPAQPGDPAAKQADRQAGEPNEAAPANALAVDSDALNPVAALARFPGPVIGAVNGAAVTGGFELALACDVLVASTAARFADTHVRVGVMPGWGLSQKLQRIVGPGRAKWVSFTGRFITAREAVDWGLVQGVVEPEALVPTALAWAAEMLEGVPETLAGYRRVIEEGAAMNLAEALRHERRVATESHQRTDPAALEARRGAVRERGQRQLSGDS